MRLIPKILWLALAFKPDLVLYVPVMTALLKSRLSLMCQLIEIAWQNFLELLQILQAPFI